MCQALGVTRGGYYRWKAEPRSKRSLENERLLFEIRRIHTKFRQTYGSPSIAHELEKDGFSCGENRVARLMKQHYIRAKTKRRYRITTDSKHNYPIVKDLVKRQFIVPSPNRVWASDITYVRTDEGWLYLAVVMDLYSRRIVGWSMKDRLHRQLVIDAFEQAVGRRNPPKGLIFHSDHGSQYASHEFRALVRKHHARSSMSRTGNCYDNACMESFFKTYKTEVVYDQRYFNRKEGMNSTFEYIEVFYNNQRRHSVLGYLSPAQFERQRILT